MTGSDNAHAGGYDLPRPSKIRLKETKSERAQKLYDREVRRQKRKDHLISRANGYAVSPPRSSSRVEESITPPRHMPKRRSRSPSVDGALERERMEFLEQEEMDRLESNPFSSYEHLPQVSVNVPKRYMPAPAAGGGSRDAIRELKRARGRVAPDLGMMDDAEYTSFIREGMDRLRRLAEQNERETRIREGERAAEAKLRREERERERREKRREARRQRARDNHKQKETRSTDPDSDTSVVELVRDSKTLARERYISIWQSLAGDAEAQQVNMRYTDIPWPVYSAAKLVPLEKAQIREFLFDLAKCSRQPEKKILRDAIRIFHPDRFFGRFLHRVRDSERERVKEGVEICSRVINDLAAENAAR